MSRRPNLLYIDCHDLGDWLGCYNRPHLHTPHLDRLAAEGAVFTQSIATAPICMPSRAATYSGRMPHSTGVTGQFPLHEGEVCLAEWFRRGGYHTTLVGTLKILNDPAWAGFAETVPVPGGSSPGETTAAVIRAHRLRRPFFLSVSFDRVHRPFGSEFDAALAEQIDVPAYLPDLPLVRKDLATLARQIERLDAEVGQILAALNDAGLRDNTLVVFTTEHGPAIGRAKHTLYDSGLKIALLLRYPPLIPAGARFDHLLSNLDLLPTLLALAALPLPSNLHGRSFAPLLAGEEFTGRSEVFAEQSWGRRAGRHYYTPIRAIRTQRYKYIHSFSDTPPYIDTDWLARFGADRQIPQARYGVPAPPAELYDLTVDPDELHNLADEPARAEILSVLRQRLLDFLAQTGDPVLAGVVPNRAGKPDVPLWEKQPDGSFRLRAYHLEESGERPFPAADKP